MASAAALRELAAAFPDRTPEELAEVLAAAGGRGDLAAETLLAEALIDQDEAEEAAEDADPHSPGAAQMRADAEYASLLQVRRRRLRHVTPHVYSFSRQSRLQTQLLAPKANAPPVSSFLVSRNHPYTATCDTAAHTSRRPS